MSTNAVKIAPSILSADFIRLKDQVQELEAGGADWIHVDVMDGRFVPNLTFGAMMIEALRRITELPLDVHLMVEEPEQYIDSFAKAGASVFTFHPEATVHVQRHLATVRDRKMLAGLALNPSTPVTVVEEVVDDLDLLLIMSVNPGYAAQRYIRGSTAKIARARQLLDEHRSPAHLQVDGGISKDTIAAAHAAGADTFVAGSAILTAEHPGQMVSTLRDLCHQGTPV